MYVYIETSSPRQPGDTARLESPWMRGPQCMTFYYHMYGSTMSCVVIFVKSQATNKLKPVWLRSQDQGDHWIQGKISINETSSYQVSRKYQSSLLIYKAINGFHLVIYPICSAFVVAPTLCVLARISYFKSRDLNLSLMVIDVFYCRT